MDFAHKRGVKVYVTMNTLLADEEMSRALEYALFLYEIGVDALIIQDLGLGTMVNEFIPDMPIHLSTQGSVYTASGVQTASEVGYERVVLARELSFDEISKIGKGTDTEIEVFVHGALCVCYSGQCQMSRNFGGRSGNRGECAQPCRLPYKSLDEENRLVDTYKYPLSPKDLCLIDHIGKLAEVGVASLKIEGRMKSPEYVAIVTSIYRKYLDLYYTQGSYAVSEEDRLALERIFNCGGFTEGYFNGDPEMDLNAGDIPKHRGIRIGKVVKSVQGTSLIDVKLYDKLLIGDGVEIQGKNITGNVVTYYKELKGGLTRIGDIKGKVNHGDPLYRVTSKEQLLEARKTFENKTYEEGKYIRKTPIKVSFSCNEQGITVLEAACSLAESKVVIEAGPFATADNVPTSKEKIEAALRKTGNTPFQVSQVEFFGTFDKVILISSINDMRKKACNELEQALTFRREEAGIIPSLMFYGSGEKPSLEFFFYQWEDYEDFYMPEGLADFHGEKRMIVPLVHWIQHYEEIIPNDNVVPYISNIAKGKEDKFIKGHFDEIVEKTKDVGIYVGNLGWIKPLIDAGVPVYGDYGLNVYNKYSRAAINGLGIERYVDSLEKVEKGFGAIPLMVSEHNPEGATLIDRKKEIFLISFC